MDALRRVRADVCVLSACSLHPGVGMTLRQREEAEVVRAMVEDAGRVVSVTTATKLGSAGPYPVADIERIDTLVSDAPDAELQVYRDLGIEVVQGMTGTPRQARGAVTAIFFLNGLVFGEWAARIPAVRDRVGLSDGELGIVLACAAVGSILAMPVAGGARRADRQPPRHARGLRAHVPGERRHRAGADACPCSARWPSSMAPRWGRST